LNQFIYETEIFIDDAGWGDLILGVVIGALKIPNHTYMERRIPVRFFQPPNFESKQYLVEAEKIGEEIVKVMRPDEKTIFKVCSGYVLSSIRRYLQDAGFRVEKVEITGELQGMVERGFARWCRSVGVPMERVNGKRNFWVLLEWVSEDPKNRESLVKTGWKSWWKKWRARVFSGKKLAGSEGES
jgi:hypothetical protein